jgi:hypothetical protein
MDTKNKLNVLYPFFILIRLSAFVFMTGIPEHLQLIQIILTPIINITVRLPHILLPYHYSFYVMYLYADHLSNEY